jgi:hypothetical protein
VVDVDLELAVEVGRVEVLVGDERVLALEEEEEEAEDLVVVAAAATPPTLPLEMSSQPLMRFGINRVRCTHVVWTLFKQLVAEGRGVVTVLVRLRALPSPFSKKPKTSKTAPSSS